VVVAAGAADGEAEETSAHGIDAVVTLVGARDLDGAVVVVPRSEAEKPQRWQMADAIRSFEQVGGELGRHELVVWQIVVEGADHPVAIQMSVRIRIEPAAHRIEAAIVVFTVASDVEPHAGPGFPVSRRGEQAIDDLLERVGRRVFQKCVHFLRRRGKTGEAERGAADQCELVGACDR